VSIRSFTTLVLVLAIFAGGSFGTANGMVLCVSSDGHLAVEPPRLSHAFRHAGGADHEPHDHDPDADHAALHEMIASCSDSYVSVQKLERSSSSFTAIDHLNPIPSLSLPGCSDAEQPMGSLNGLAVAPPRGGTARRELASLRSVILLV
jgi:hypothetical protein